MIKEYFYQLSTFTLLATSIVSCEIINPDEEIPSYIHIDTINVIITDPVQGSASHKISDAWVYLDENLIGAFELPVTLPILASGKHNIKIRAGIKLNGITASRVFYPFYDFYSQEIDLKLTKIDTLKPAVNYFSSAIFAWKEDFEDSGFKIEKLSGSDTAITLINDPSLVFEGNSCGAIFLDENKKIFKGSSLSSTPLNLPKGGFPVFLEMNYKNNQRFHVGIIAVHPSYKSEVVVLTLNPSENWNKIYINLTNDVSNNVGATGYYLFLYAEKESSVSYPAIYLDNLKIIH